MPSPGTCVGLFNDTVTRAEPPINADSWQLKVSWLLGPDRPFTNEKTWCSDDERGKAGRKTSQLFDIQPMWHLCCTMNVWMSIIFVHFLLEIAADVSASSLFYQLVYIILVSCLKHKQACQEHLVFVDYFVLSSTKIIYGVPQGSVLGHLLNSWPHYLVVWAMWKYPFFNFWGFSPKALLAGRLVCPPLPSWLSSLRWIGIESGNEIRVAQRMSSHLGNPPDFYPSRVTGRSNGSLILWSTATSLKWITTAFCAVHFAVFPNHSDSQHHVTFVKQAVEQVSVRVFKNGCAKRAGHDDSPSVQIGSWMQGSLVRRHFGPVVERALKICTQIHKYTYFTTILLNYKSNYRY